MEHFCYVCHRLRSWRYHLQYPITFGTSSIPSICTRCMKKQSREAPFHKLKTSIESPPLRPSSRSPQSSLPSSPVIYEVHHYHHCCQCKKKVANKDSVLYAELHSESSS
ncbi:hypothetical protein OCU04_012683 [Sclerotinia nivalis]|uniref:Uncharacterized protein n=1 Tax=Sclerotinia nivalis TaxID=352851 RepID=A0A9X0A931_9HELO|nr:hypothetical protein OCU04_012683 [Sclerotinia nivalis]